MKLTRAWQDYAPTYREKECRQVVDWLLRGVSGSVIGLAGAGKSNFLGFLANRPDVIANYIPKAFSRSLVVLPIDLNNLPSYSLSTFYRVILRGFYEINGRFNPDVQQKIQQLFRDYKDSQDAFLPQTALRELFITFHEQQMRVALVFDRFDKFIERGNPRLTDTLRGLRDSFKDNICFIVGLKKSILYQDDADVLGELYELLDTHQCWIGPMSEADGQRMVLEETQTAVPLPTKEEISALLRLTGAYPALIKAGCHWWLDHREAPMAAWPADLLAQPSIQHRLQELWRGLSQEEQLALSELQMRSAKQQSGRAKQRADAQFATVHPVAITKLRQKGILKTTAANSQDWQIFSPLFATFIGTVEGRGRGKLWFAAAENMLYQGKRPLSDLSPLEGSLLHFLVTHPQIRHTYTAIVAAAWPEEENWGVAPEAVQQVVKQIRRKIEPNPPNWHYIINWRGQPEGGYICYPEGKPE